MTRRRKPPRGYGPGAYGYGPPPPRKSWPRRHKILTGLGLLVAFVFLVSIIAGVAGSKSSNNGGSTSSGGSTSTSSSGGAGAQAGIGTPVRDGKFQFTITKVTHAKSVGDTAAGLGSTAQGEYTILHIVVTNIGGQSQALDDNAQYVYDASGRQYSASSSADLSLNNGGGVFLNDINPGNSVRGVIAFDMPAGVKAVKAVLHDSLLSGGVTVSLH